MSKKRTAAESSNDDETTEGSDPVSQQQSDAKRAKLVSLSDTTLEDLPIELLKCILVKVVVTEVKDMRLAKSVWKEKADFVINRLCTVGSPWSSICATNFFRTEVHRTLDSTAQKTIRFEILHHYPIPIAGFDLIVMKDEVFMLCKPNGEHFFINVHDCSNMAEVKDVIPLPGLRPEHIAVCSISNCVYVHHVEVDQSKGDSILRITKAEEHQFTLSPWITTDEKLSLLTVSANSSIITVSKKQTPNPPVLSIYAANGSLQHKIVLYPEVYKFREVENVMQRSNGNLVLVLVSLINATTAELMEIDTLGIVVRRYKASLGLQISVNFADIHGRILIGNWQKRFELLDSEFNRLDVTGVQPNDTWVFLPRKLLFDNERNQMMCILRYLDPTSAFGLAIFRFVSE